MRRAAVLVALLVALALVASASADTGDKDSLATTSGHVGDRLTLRLIVVTPRGAAVDVVPGAPAWNGVEVVRTSADVTRDTSDGTEHTLSLVIAAFNTGPVDFQPVVAVSVGPDVTTRTLPKLTVNVASVLQTGDPLELTPLPPPEGIAGGQSPLLVPGIIAGAGVALALIVAATIWAAMTFRRRPRRGVDVPEQRRIPTLPAADQFVAGDPVTGYRSIATTVRYTLGERYGIPAPALTTRELQRRMESAGIDRWQARLAGGLLEECDAVVYAGYRPAAERRMADLTMARELVEPEALHEPAEASA